MKVKEKEIREIEVKHGMRYPAGGSRGYFHGWCKEPFYNESGSYLTKTFALVELADGDVQLIEPSLIRFRNPLSSEID